MRNNFVFCPVDAECGQPDCLCRATLYALLWRGYTMEIQFCNQFASFLSESKENLLPTRLAAALSTVARFDAWRLISIDTDGEVAVIDFRNFLKCEEDYRGQDLSADPIISMAKNMIGHGYYTSEELAPRGLITTQLYEQALGLGLVLTDHVGFVAEVDARRSICLSLSRSDLLPAFTKAENDMFCAVAPLVVHALKRIGAGEAATDPQSSAENAGDAMDLQEVVLESFGFTTLSPRERDVAKLLFEGHSAKAIARSLEISPGTVRNHIKNIYLKLRLNSRGEFYNRYVGEVLRARAA
ncbi:response regulator transcription factor [Hoeflea poritis]|uniref:LuxR C-terminal-related transcriptional regulator n=1 Tax=Hoeflea poritis TaxID=2993659 RepID=A0ABT4VVX2_9HYPH|nr:LuxR C-terminal-related transcriptional regulator [Hoeflea poritis]MDA4848856.1 LuxR C-terminal-related transcriptional regulator [Hoeflea poritis]